MTKIISDKPMWRTMYALFAPLIVWPGYEKDGERWRMRIQKARFDKIAANDESKRATDEEVALYLSTASLIAPLDKNSAKIYEYVAMKSFPEIKQAFTEIPNKLTEEQQKEYNRLAEWIFKQQTEALNKKFNKKRMRS